MQPERFAVCGTEIDGEPEPCGLLAGHDQHLSTNVIGWQHALGGQISINDVTARFSREDLDEAYVGGIAEGRRGVAAEADEAYKRGMLAGRDLGRRQATEGAIVEHAIQMSGGGMHVRYDDPEIERIFPLADWIKSNQRFGGKVYRRSVVVVEDWAEVELVPTVNAGLTVAEQPKEGDALGVTDEQRQDGAKLAADFRQRWLTPRAGTEQPELVALVGADDRCGCCLGAGEHRCGHECSSCDGAGRNPDSPVCRLPHGADCRCAAAQPERRDRAEAEARRGR